LKNVHQERLAAAMNQLSHLGVSFILGSALLTATTDRFQRVQLTEKYDPQSPTGRADALRTLMEKLEKRLGENERNQPEEQGVAY
jgi:hypothetical protein